MAEIIDTGKDLYPKQREFKKVHARFEGLLSDTQKEGINRILTATKKDRSARVILGDGTGVGKTMQLLASAWAISKRTSLPSLVVTKTGLLPALEDGCTKAEISPKKVMTSDYGDLPKALTKQRFGAILCDEAHVLENHPRLQEIQKNIRSSSLILASATTFTCPSTAVCLLSLILDVPQEVTLKNLDLIEEQDYLIPKTSWERTTGKLLKAKEKLMTSGLCLQRFLAFKGNALWRENPTHSRTDALVKQTIREIKEGRKVILYSSNPEIHQATTHLDKVCPVGFQEDRGNLIILDPLKNAEGIRLHDRTGNSPRTILVDGSFGADDLIQIQGRAHRRKAKSPTKLVGFYDSKSDSQKLATLAATTKFLKEQREFPPALGIAALEIHRNPEKEPEPEM